MKTAQTWMRQALRLAAKGQSTSYPNPMVGAVIVRDGRVIGKGWHRGPGYPHAEVCAIENCRENPAGAILYVTLEPCNHFGKTPPCTETILRAGIREVYYAIADPNPHVSGGGAGRLRTSGVNVTEGLLREVALEQNRMYFKYCLTGFPWVVVKAGMSLDGKITGNNGESRWITCRSSRNRVHQLRSQVGAVLIGKGTLVADNPHLTNRVNEVEVRQPEKIVLDSQLTISLQSHLVNETPEKLLIFCNREASREKEVALQNRGVRVIRYPGNWLSPEKLLKILGKLGVQSILVEGGSTVYTELVASNLVDEYQLFYAPFFIGGERSLPLLQGDVAGFLDSVPRLQIRRVRRIGVDLWVQAYREELNACLPVVSKISEN